MGLGLNSGGLYTALHLASRGAELCITDLGDEKTLAPTIEQLSHLPIRYVLGKHEMADFEWADLVIKNPGVRPDSPFLKEAKAISTDISLFLDESPARILAVTGSKGKSSVSSALHWVLSEHHRGSIQSTQADKASYLGGNITLSPLSFLDRLNPQDDVVLELSSFQLGDLRGRNTLKPRGAIMTPIMRDHLDRYGTMESYIADKRLIYENQDEGDLIVAQSDRWGQSFIDESRARPLVYSDAPLEEGISGGWVQPSEGSRGPGLARLYGRGARTGQILEVVPPKPLVLGAHQKQNLLMAALALLDLGLDSDFIRDSLGRFKGVEHRLEFFHQSGGMEFYNDSAATIPEAAAAALHAFEQPPVLVTGGTDKDLDFSPLARAALLAKAVILLAGTGSQALSVLLEAQGIPYQGPFDSLEGAIEAVEEAAAPGDPVVLSPGCASFGMFTNEFYRGLQWKEKIRKHFP